MDYTKEKGRIVVHDKSQFNIEHILECGQVFCFDKRGDDYIVFPQDKVAILSEKDDCVEIVTKHVEFFADYFDLDTDYNQIKSKLSKFEIMKKPLDFGYGIRILKQDLFECLISFIISANNNIKRIKLILGNLRKNLGDEIGDGVYSFPSFEKLQSCNQEFFKSMGAGYRAAYLEKVCSQITPELLDDWRKLDTPSLRKNLISLSGVGPKVADCVLLFAYHRSDVFPVDTWINQMYNQYFSPLENREKISRNLVETFGNLAGFAQQYLFYYQRSGE